MEIISGRNTTGCVLDKKWSTSHYFLLENYSKLTNKVFVPWERFLLESLDCIIIEMKIDQCSSLNYRTSEFKCDSIEIDLI